MEDEKICDICGMPIHTHIIQEGSRKHVTSYYLMYDNRDCKEHGVSKCSDPLCENNHGYGIGQCGQHKPIPDIVKRRMKKVDDYVEKLRKQRKDVW